MVTEVEFVTLAYDGDRSGDKQQRWLLNIWVCISHIEGEQKQQQLMNWWPLYFIGCGRYNMRQTMQTISNFNNRAGNNIQSLNGKQASTKASSSHTSAVQTRFKHALESSSFIPWPSSFILLLDLYLPPNYPPPAFSQTTRRRSPSQQYHIHRTHHLSNRIGLRHC